MSKWIVFLIVMALAFLGAVLCAAGYIVNILQVNVVQPIQFNHKLHLEEDMECIDCHQYYKTQKNSGKPTLGICMDCHEIDDSDSLELKTLYQYAQRGADIPWQRIYYLPGHVYFSHRLHTQKAEIKCETCHGAMGEQVAPPNKPMVLHSMDFCIDCHKESGASQDCLTCHQ